MLIVSTKLSKQKLVLAVFLVVVLGALLLALPGREPAPTEPIPGETDVQRLEYLASLGWIAGPEPSETLEFTLPDPLGETYEAYNRLQQLQGFDLTPYAGRQVKRYSYPVTNHPEAAEGVQADLYVCDGIVIGGDILRAGADSSVSTLEFPA